ncbi:YxeA family protein [Pediococcus claussenii]|uniref:Conserved hypothetical family protein n=1 Tax=Pediococcus claussenii (strain ATCC BAA-344 / DSM 14800 / JCM 18046 / KCTC 3811 / LMG 21948 / P06) TaxID=701521 RepID=G8PC69_PEDCP|nr:YxeA family protein [Pediococcus claussenii]AEV96047.1 conserved hypothetical family protein [Pediococcus claussenii ATCC BAA-344]ANZ69530.1 hypothetical protein AYR57_04035 [Pediococcus claussenii]ANZ71349.1 hypothetical protein AYR58_04050 [Pediococcus claussenii]KRN19429.1 hypothetical protein IV79_GL001481 [Pediococcus claussenii]
MEYITKKWTELSILLLLVLFIIGNVGWFVYRYSGEHYYMRITKSVSTHPVTLAVSIPSNGYTYQGEARTASGKEKFLTLKTTSANPGPFKKGQIVRVTVNQNFGNTNYKVVSSMPNTK